MSTCNLHAPVEGSKDREGPSLSHVPWILIAAPIQKETREPGVKNSKKDRERERPTNSGGREVESHLGTLRVVRRVPP